MRLQARSLLAPLLLTVALAGCSEPEQDQDWPGRDLDATDPPWRDTELQPGHALEMDFPLRQGDLLEYDWFTMDRERLRFQIHYHTADGGDVTAFQTTTNEHTGPFTADASAMHSLMWLNLGDAPVELWIQVEGEQCYRDASGNQRCGTVVEI